MTRQLKILVVDDSEDDALLLARKLKAEGYGLYWERVEEPGPMKAALEDKTWDAIICDCVMPKFSARNALKILKERGTDLPFIVMSGVMGEETAVEMMTAGAHDYIKKDNMARLVPAIERELQEAEMRRERRRMEEDLRELNISLQKRVDEEIAKRRQQEQALAQQSKLAAMGEMLVSIAHHWRQPLNAIGLIVQNLKDSYEYNELSKEQLDASVCTIMEKLQSMSKTIDSFRSFFKPSERKGPLDIKIGAGEVLEMLSAELKSHSIGYRLTCHVHDRTATDVSEIIYCKDMTIETYKSEFKQIVLSIINNSKEAIIEARQRGLPGNRAQGAIAFDFYREGDRIVVRMTDNGGGIPEEIKDRIFEPYFTTKEKSYTTGMGLYMAKVITERSLGGRIYAENVADGARITLELPAV